MATLTEQFTALNDADLSGLQERVNLIIAKLQEEYDLNRAQQIEIDVAEKINITQEDEISALEKEISALEKEIDAIKEELKQTKDRLNITLTNLERNLSEFSKITIGQKADELRFKYDELMFMKSLEKAKGLAR